MQQHVGVQRHLPRAKLHGDRLAEPLGLMDALTQHPLFLVGDVLERNHSASMTSRPQHHRAIGRVDVVDGEPHGHHLSDSESITGIDLVIVADIRWQGAPASAAAYRRLVMISTWCPFHSPSPSGPHPSFLYSCCLSTVNR